MRFKTFVESLDSGIEFTVPPHRIDDDIFTASAEIGGRMINIHATLDDEELNSWDFSFGEDDMFDVSLNGKGDELKIFSMVKKSLIAFAHEVKPSMITFTADNDEGSRASAYERMIKRFIIPEYELAVDRTEKSFTHFTLKRKS